jgi:cytochrome c oxidase assembly factor CtaG
MVGKISAEGANLIVAIYSHININRLSSIVSSSPVLQPRSLLVRTSTRMALFFSPFLCQGVGVLSKKRMGGGVTWSSQSLPLLFTLFLLFTLLLSLSSLFVCELAG